MKWMNEGMANPLETNTALFEAALDEFAAHTFENASLNVILKAAGMNKGSFYYRFYDKMELYLSLLMKIGEGKMAVIKQDEAETPENVGFFEDFRKKALIGLHFAKTQPRYYALFQRFLEEEGDVRNTVFTHFGGMLESFMEQMIIRAMQRGELRADLPVQTTALIISTLLSKIDTVIPPDLDDDKSMESIDILLDILKNGMAN